MADCNKCANKKLPSYSATCVECGLVRKGFKPMTNADRMRTMTDEELADFILKRDIGIVDRLSQLQVFIYNFDVEKGKKDLLAWLKREVDDETN